MKFNLIQWLTLGFFMFLMGYGILAFANTDINIMNWGFGSRLVAGIWGAVTFIRSLTCWSDEN